MKSLLALTLLLALGAGTAHGQTALRHATIGPSPVGVTAGPLRLTGRVGAAFAQPALAHAVRARQAAARAAHAAASATDGLPRAFALAANYPNPFNPSTHIGFDLPEAATVRLAVFDVLGRQVAMLAEGAYPAGRHTARFDASELAAGVYLYLMAAGDFVAVRRMVLLK